VAATFGTGLLAFFLVLSLADGARDAVVQPLGDTLVGDVRIVNGTQDLASGNIWTDVRPLAAQINRLAHTHASPRYESSYITVQGNSFDNWSAGLLVGFDTSDPDENQRLAPYLVWGHVPNTLSVFHPQTGKAYPPLLLGQAAAQRLNLTAQGHDGPLFDSVLTITSGRLVAQGSVPIPATTEVVLVGVFATGIQPVDKFTAYLPIQTARLLAGHNENDPVANSLAVRTSDAKAVASAVAQHPGHSTQTAEAFAFGYMGGMLVILYTASGLGLALFLLVLLVWLSHELGVLIQNDRPVISSLRAIGIRARDIHRSYALPLAASVGVGALAALLAMILLAAFAPPIAWNLSSLRASIPWRIPVAALAIVLGAVALATGLTTWLAARRVARLNILDGLRAT
jgi:ABC-type lipoprotein release transport system permease subunit